jgi:hypothetical protein
MILPDPPDSNADGLYTKQQIADYGRECAQAALQSVRIQIPTDTMEQEFASYYRMGVNMGKRLALKS